jgi:hypothetical protein
LLLTVPFLLGAGHGVPNRNPKDPLNAKSAQNSLRMPVKGEDKLLGSSDIYMGQEGDQDAALKACRNKYVIDPVGYTMVAKNLRIVKWSQ